MTWLTSHYQDIVTAVVSVVIAARVIVKLTPTPKDDSVLDSVVTFLKHLGLHIEA
jgi:hypothetical protein